MQQDIALPLLKAINPSLSHVISSTIATFSICPHPTNKDGPTTPVELTTSFRLLGNPIGTALFARDFFQTCLTTVTSNIQSLSTSISDEQIKLRLFSQCIIQKIPHLLLSDILYHLPTGNHDPPWEE
jgi:hypothetical protein